MQPQNLKIQLFPRVYTCINDASMAKLGDEFLGTQRGARPLINKWNYL